MELSDYLRILRKNWALILIAALIGVSAAAAYSLTRTPQYESKSVVFVQSQAGSTVSDLTQGSNFVNSQITSYVLLVSEPIVLRPVIEEFNLDLTPDELADKVVATNPANSTHIQITVTDPDPVLAADLANALSDSLATTVAEIDSPLDTEEATIKLTSVREATPAASPSSPNVRTNLALGLLVGLAVGLGVAVLRTILDNRIRSPKDIEQITNLPLIGAIPLDPKTSERPVIVDVDPHNPRAEAIRALRTNLQFLEMDGGHSFVVTSSVPAEGKSTTTLNLAIALADSGKRVALIDTDLRKPKLADYLGIEGGVGLSDALIGRAKLADVMLPWGKPSLYVLPAGKIPPNPSELLGSERMQQLLEALSKEFDVVLCDAPPLLPVTDAAVLSRSIAGAILVVAVGQTTVQQVEGSLAVLETVGAKVAGVVMTKVPTTGADAYSYGYGGFGNHPETGPWRTITKRASRRVPARTTRRSSASSEPQPESAQRTSTAQSTNSLDDLFES